MLEQKIYEFVTKYGLIENGDKIVLGVSGGPDSICMLDIFYKIKLEGLLQFEMFVAHVNHSLRENAILDEEFVKRFCEKIGVPCFVKQVDVMQIAKSEKRGLEETGRKVRYAFFDEIQEKVGANKIAIAHNQNDHAETIIMNILRGTGTKGLVGMEKINGKYIRPLLDTKRLEIEEYLRENKISARLDESNHDNSYTRNKIRNIVLPYIQKEFNPNIVDTLERLSSLAKEQEEYFYRETKKIFEQICMLEEEHEIILNLKQFHQIEEILQKRVILYAVERLLGTIKGIEKIHMDDIIKLCRRNVGNKYLTPNKHVKVALQNKNLKITKM